MTQRAIDRLAADSDLEEDRRSSNRLLMPGVKGEPPLRLRARPSTMRPAERSPTLCWDKLRGRLRPRAPLKSLQRPLPLSLSLSLSWFLTATTALLRAEIPLDGRSLNQAPFHLLTPRPADSLALRQPFGVS